jgi:hypothetical protein
MAAATLRKNSLESKPAGKESPAAAPVNQVALTAAVFEACGRIAADQEATGVCRDDIPTPI